MSRCGEPQVSPCFEAYLAVICWGSWVAVAGAPAAVVPVADAPAAVAPVAFPPPAAAAPSA